MKTTGPQFSRFTVRRAVPLAMVATAFGLLMVPVIAGAATSTTTISSVISPVISLFTSGPTVNLPVTPTSGGSQTIASDTVTVSTNDSAGYTLQLADTSSSNTNLVSGSNNIAASAGTQAAPVAMVTNTWGYRVDSIGGFGAGPTSGATNQAISAVKFAGMPVSTSPNTIATTATTASNVTTSVWYADAANFSQPSGTYTTSITYTATTN